MYVVSDDVLDVCVERVGVIVVVARRSGDEYDVDENDV